MRPTMNRQVGRPLRPNNPRSVEDININRPDYGGNKPPPTSNQINPMYTMPSGGINRPTMNKPMPTARVGGPPTFNAMANPHYGGQQINPMMSYPEPFRYGQPSQGGKYGEMQPSPYGNMAMNNDMSAGKDGSPPQQSSGKGGQQPYQNSGKGGSSSSGGK